MLLSAAGNRDLSRMFRKSLIQLLTRRKETRVVERREHKQRQEEDKGGGEKQEVNPT